MYVQLNSSTALAEALVEALSGLPRSQDFPMPTNLKKPETNPQTLLKVFQELVSQSRIS
ncbi:unnamed protein product, partial [marine sediment metagenome]